MNYILSDGIQRKALLPFTFTRPVSEIRIGILTIREKWEKYLNTSISFKTEEYLSEKFPMEKASKNTVIVASFLPNESLVGTILGLKNKEALFYKDRPVAYVAENPEHELDFSGYRTIQFEGDILTVDYTWDIFSKNGEALRADFDLITKGRKSAPISDTNRLICPENIFLEEGASVGHSILNATKGPIYLGKDAQIWEGSMVRGAFALCDHAMVKMGAKIYGPTTVGPHGKICGEVNNSVIFGYSSKGHDGYLGNAVLGEWCNIVLTPTIPI